LQYDEHGDDDNDDHNDNDNEEDYCFAVFVVGKFNLMVSSLPGEGSWQVVGSCFCSREI
jgi:hypothetical protein